MKPVAILGASGHAAVIKEALDLMGREVAGCFESDYVSLGDVFLTLGMGRRSQRERCVRVWTSRGAADSDWLPVIHPSAIVSKSAVIEPGAQIMAGAIIQAGARIGRHAIINTGAQVDHGCFVGDFAHVCPGAVLCADVAIDHGAMVGPGCTVPRGLHVPSAAVIE